MIFFLLLYLFFGLTFWAYCKKILPFCSKLVGFCVGVLILGCGLLSLLSFILKDFSYSVVLENIPSFEPFVGNVKLFIWHEDMADDEYFFDPVGRGYLNSDSYLMKLFRWYRNLFPIRFDYDYGMHTYGLVGVLTYIFVILSYGTELSAFATELSRGDLPAQGKPYTGFHWSMLNHYKPLSLAQACASGQPLSRFTNPYTMLITPPAIRLKSVPTFPVFALERATRAPEYDLSSNFLMDFYALFLKFTFKSLYEADAYVTPHSRTFSDHKKWVHLSSEVRFARMDSDTGRVSFLQLERQVPSGAERNVNMEVYKKAFPLAAKFFPPD